MAILQNSTSHIQWKHNFFRKSLEKIICNGYLPESIFGNSIAINDHFVSIHGKAVLCVLFANWKSIHKTFQVCVFHSLEIFPKITWKDVMEEQ